VEGGMNLDTFYWTYKTVIAVAVVVVVVVVVVVLVVIGMMQAGGGADNHNGAPIWGDSRSCLPQRL